MYFPCVEGKSIYGDIKMTIAYSEKKAGIHLESLSTHLRWEDHAQPVPRRKLEGFFLIPERLSWILAPYARELYIKDRDRLPFQPGAPKHLHSNKYCFRLLYFVCTDRKILDDQASGGTYVYPEKQYCQHLQENRHTHWLWEDKTKPVPTKTIEGFFLVPENLYWILVPFAKAFFIKDRWPQIITH
jgi:hypothetical protein